MYYLCYHFHIFCTQSPNYGLYVEYNICIHQCAELDIGSHFYSELSKTVLIFVVHEGTVSVLAHLMINTGAW